MGLIVSPWHFLEASTSSLNHVLIAEASQLIPLTPTSASQDVSLPTYYLPTLWFFSGHDRDIALPENLISDSCFLHPIRSPPCSVFRLFLPQLLSYPSFSNCPHFILLFQPGPGGTGRQMILRWTEEERGSALSLQLVVFAWNCSLPCFSLDCFGF